MQNSILIFVKIHKKNHLVYFFFFHFLFYKEQQYQNYLNLMIYKIRICNSHLILFFHVVFPFNFSISKANYIFMLCNIYFDKNYNLINKINKNKKNIIILIS
jgi:hypothetical protein